jgi:SAM-dependent methyltransferase
VEELMTEVTPSPVRRYILDGDDEDLRRLLSISELTAGPARAAFGRAGIAAGWAAIDCGCGPIGGLPVLAELVGREGRVVGVDINELAIGRARTVTATLGLDNVELFAGDIHDLDPVALGAPFDLAYTRLFLMHQPDPVQTLTAIARLVRPGGWIIVQEPLADPAPRSHPPLAALGSYWDLLHQVLAEVGVLDGTVAGLPGSARAAGLEVVTTDGFFLLSEPELVFEIHAGTLEAFRERVVRSGRPAETVDALVAAMRAGKAGGYEWVTTPFFVDLALRKTAEAG